jgi:hypothetical protein
MYADNFWLEHHSAHSRGGKACYVRGAGAPMKNIFEGSWVHLMRAGEKPKRVHLSGRFLYDEKLQAGSAWGLYGQLLGAPTQAAWLQLVDTLEHVKRTGEIRLIHLDQLFVPDQPVPLTDAGLHERQHATKGWGLTVKESDSLVGKLGLSRE